MKKRKVMAEMPINQNLAAGLEDSLFGRLTEEVMFHILHRISRNYTFPISKIFLYISFCNLKKIQLMI